MIKRLLTLAVFVMVLYAMIFASIVNAGCPCDASSHSGAYHGSIDAGQFHSAPLMPSYPHHIYGEAPYSPLPMGDSAYTGAAPLASIQGDSNPPPGTLGQTYQLRSRPMPPNRHPRSSMVEIHTSGATAIIVHGTNPVREEEQAEGFRDANNSDIWYFETDPLYPGLPHIYRIEVRYGSGPSHTVQERFVRMIMGRIVEITI